MKINGSPLPLTVQAAQARAQSQLFSQCPDILYLDTGAMYRACGLKAAALISI